MQQEFSSTVFVFFLIILSHLISWFASFVFNMWKQKSFWFFTPFLITVGYHRIDDRKICVHNSMIGVMVERILWVTISLSHTFNQHLSPSIQWSQTVSQMFSIYHTVLYCVWWSFYSRAENGPFRYCLVSKEWEFRWSLSKSDMTSKPTRQRFPWGKKRRKKKYSLLWLCVY